MTSSFGAGFGQGAFSKPYGQANTNFQAGGSIEQQNRLQQLCDKRQPRSQAIFQRFYSHLTPQELLAL